MTRFYILGSFICIVFLMGSANACKKKKNNEQEEAVKNCYDFTKPDECIEPNAIKNKTCIWDKDECIEKPIGPVFNECKDITPKEQDACEKPNAIKNKTCVWDNNKCIESSLTDLKDFSSQDRIFKNDIKNTNSYGIEHGEQPGWSTLCNNAIKTTNLGADTTKVLKNIEIKFKKDKTEFEITFECTNNDKKSYELKYKAIALPDGLIKITPDLNNQSAMGKDTMDQNTVYNQLEFFTKTHWFYDKKNLLVPIYLLSNKKKELMEDKKDLDAGMTEIKSNDYYFDSANDWGGLLFIFEK